MSLPGNWTITKMVAFWIVMRKPRLQKGAVPWSCWWQVAILEVKPIYHALGFYFSCKTQHFMIIIIKTKSQPSALPEDRCFVFEGGCSISSSTVYVHPCLKTRWQEWAPMFETKMTRMGTQALSVKTVEPVYGGLTALALRPKRKMHCFKRQ